MSYSVLLQFDYLSDESIMKLWESISEYTGNYNLLDAELRPHITISTFDDTNIDELCDKVSSFSKNISEFKLWLWSIGIFPFDPRVFYLAPVPSIELIRVYQDFYTTFVDQLEGISSYCLQDHWVPHCATAIDIPSSDAHKVLSILLEQFTPIEAVVREIAIIESDGNNKYIARYPLKQ